MMINKRRHQHAIASKSDSHRVHQRIPGPFRLSLDALYDDNTSDTNSDRDEAGDDNNDFESTSLSQRPLRPSVVSDLAVGKASIRSLSRLGSMPLLSPSPLPTNATTLLSKRTARVPLHFATGQTTTLATAQKTLTTIHRNHGRLPVETMGGYPSIAPIPNGRYSHPSPTSSRSSSHKQQRVSGAQTRKIHTNYRHTSEPSVTRLDALGRVTCSSARAQLTHPTVSNNDRHHSKYTQRDAGRQSTSAATTMLTLIDTAHTTVTRRNGVCDALQEFFDRFEQQWNDERLSLIANVLTAEEQAHLLCKCSTMLMGHIPIIKDFIQQKCEPVVQGLARSLEPSLGSVIAHLDCAQKSRSMNCLNILRETTAFISTNNALRIDVPLDSVIHMLNVEYSDHLLYLQSQGSSSLSPNSKRDDGVGEIVHPSILSITKLCDLWDEALEYIKSMPSVFDLQAEDYAAMANTLSQLRDQWELEGGMFDFYSSNGGVAAGDGSDEGAKGDDDDEETAIDRIIRILNKRARECRVARRWRRSEHELGQGGWSQQFETLRPQGLARHYHQQQQQEQQQAPKKNVEKQHTQEQEEEGMMEGSQGSDLRPSWARNSSLPRQCHSISSSLPFKRATAGERDDPQRRRPPSVLENDFGLVCSEGSHVEDDEDGEDTLLDLSRKIIVKMEEGVPIESQSSSIQNCPTECGVEKGHVGSLTEATDEEESKATLMASLLSLGMMESYVPDAPTTVASSMVADSVDGASLSGEADDEEQDGDGVSPSASFFTPLPRKRRRSSEDAGMFAEDEDEEQEAEASAVVLVGGGSAPMVDDCRMRADLHSYQVAATPEARVASLNNPGFAAFPNEPFHQQRRQRQYREQSSERTLAFEVAEPLTPVSSASPLSYEAVAGSNSDVSEESLEQSTISPASLPFAQSWHGKNKRKRRVQSSSDVNGDDNVDYDGDHDHDHEIDTDEQVEREPCMNQDHYHSIIPPLNQVPINAPVWPLAEDDDGTFAQQQTPPESRQPKEQRQQEPAMPSTTNSSLQTHGEIPEELLHHSLPVDDTPTTMETTHSPALRDKEASITAQPASVRHRAKVTRIRSELRGLRADQQENFTVPDNLSRGQRNRRMIAGGYIVRRIKARKKKALEDDGSPVSSSTSIAVEADGGECTNKIRTRSNSQRPFRPVATTTATTTQVLPSSSCAMAHPTRREKGAGGEQSGKKRERARKALLPPVFFTGRGGQLRARTVVAGSKSAQRPLHPLQTLRRRTLPRR